MLDIYCEKINELKREKEFLEKKLNTKIKITGKKVQIQGDSINEYESEMVIDAISLGFPARMASLLTNENFIFEKINIKNYARNKNLKVVKSRLIGTHGKTKKTIEQISGCNIVIKENMIGIICPAESTEYIITAIINLIIGSKQTNIYKYLEKINTLKKAHKF